MIGFENPTRAAVPATPATIAQTLHPSLDLDTSGLNEGAAGDVVLTGPFGSRIDRKTVAMGRDGRELSASPRRPECESQAAVRQTPVERCPSDITVHKAYRLLPTRE